MKPSIASLFVFGLAVSAGPHGVMSAQPVRHQAAGVDILVNGVPQRHYAHEGRWYVEALKGKEYAIRMRNPYPVRVAVALSVDGLNTIDARHTTAADARKWVIEPFQTVTISGWQVNSAEARRFEFTTEARSVRSGPRPHRQPGNDLGRVLQGTRAGDRPRVVSRSQRASGSRRAGCATGCFG